MQARLVKISLLFFYKHFKMVIIAYNFKGITISNNMRTYFKQFASSCLNSRCSPGTYLTPLVETNNMYAPTLN